MELTKMVDGQLMQSFAFYAGILLFKMTLMSGMTSINRLRRKDYANAEDAAAFGGDKINLADTVVERIRRCHLNDLENIYVFVLLGFFYCFTLPSHGFAVWLFRIFTVSRLAHMFVYLNEARQPRRFLTWLVGWVCCWIMAVQILRATCDYK